MPYIDTQNRTCVDNSHPVNSGELNYSITKLINVYLKMRELNYKTLNDIVGALEAAKLEFYRRIVVPYEEKKLKENGDVYDKVFTKKQRSRKG